MEEHNAQYGNGEANHQRTGIAHKYPGGRDIVTEEANYSTHQAECDTCCTYITQHGKAHAQYKATQQGYGPGQAIYAVYQVKGIGNKDDPKHRKRDACPVGQFFYAEEAMERVDADICKANCDKSGYKLGKEFLVRSYSYQIVVNTGKEQKQGRGTYIVPFIKRRSVNEYRRDDDVGKEDAYASQIRDCINMDLPFVIRDVKQPLSFGNINYPWYRYQA